MRKSSLIALVLLLTVIVEAPTAAQAPAADSWKITVAPYFMGAAMNGTTAVKGQEVVVDASFSDILKDLQFGAMGLVVARKGDWGVGGDAIWMALGANLSKRASIAFGYRWLDIDYTSGEDLTLFKYDVLTQGPCSASGSGSEADTPRGTLEEGHRGSAQRFPPPARPCWTATNSETPPSRWSGSDMYAGWRSCAARCFLSSRYLC